MRYDVNLSTAPVPLCRERKGSLKSLLGLQAAWRVCKLSGVSAGMQEGVTTPCTSAHHSHLSPPSPVRADTPRRMHTWWLSTSSLVLV